VLTVYNAAPGSGVKRAVQDLVSDLEVLGTAGETVDRSDAQITIQMNATAGKSETQRAFEKLDDSSAD
jgi:hypothetical protein